MSTETRFSLVRASLIFGGTCGLGLFAGESIVAVSTGTAPNPVISALALLAYFTFGICIAAFVQLASLIPARTSQVGRQESLIGRIRLVSIAAIVTLVQGAVLINELILWQSPILTPAGFTVDFLWTALVVGQAFILVALARRLSAGQLGFSLVLGVFLASLLVETVARLTDPPAVIQLRVAVAQTAVVFAVAAVSFTVPVVVSRIASTVTSCSSFAAVGVSNLVVAVVVVATWIVFMSSVPEYNFEERPGSQTIRVTAPNVILIVIDTLRADHLSCYGYPLQTTPNLDSLSRGSVLYERCYSPANWTPPGHASIFTGRLPISHGAHKARLGQGSRYPTCFPLPERETTVAELLSEAGYVTVAVVANYGFVSKAYGLDQGFQYWFASPPTRTRFTLLSVAKKVAPDAARHLSADLVFYRRAAEITEIALDWIRGNGDRPFFLFINLMDPHSPYSPPARWDHRFDGKLEGFVPDANELRLGRSSFSAREWQHIRSQYDGEIAYVDSELGQFFAALDRDGILSRSIVVVTSDHGEFLGERGLLDHQIGLYDPVIRVPLIIKVAGGMELPPALERETHTIDISPTILDLLGLDIPASIQGTSLLRNNEHPVIAQHYADEHIQDWYEGRFSTDQIAVVSEGFKLITGGDKAQELYDLESDGAELQNLATVDGERLDRYREILNTWRVSVEELVRPEDATATMDTDTLQRLEALGYVR